MKFCLNLVLIFLLGHATGVLLNGDPFRIPDNQSIRLLEFTTAETNCLIIRDIMEALPAYVSLKKGIKDFFKRAPLQNMKSFREIAMNVFQKIDYSDEENRLQIAKRITELTNLKQQYRNKFRTDIDMEFGREVEKQSQLELKIESIDQQIQATNKEIKADFDEQIKSLNQMVEFVKESIEDQNENSLKSQIHKYKVFENLLNRSNLFFRDADETAKFTEFIENNFDDLDKLKNEVENLVVKNKEQKRLKNLLQGLNFYGEIIEYKEEADGNFDYIELLSTSEVEKDYKSIQTFSDDARKSIENSVKKIQSKIKGKMKGIRKEFKKRKQYQKYIKSIKTLRKFRATHKQKYGQLESLQEARQKLANKSRNLDMSDDVSFTIAQDSIDHLEDKIMLLEKNAEIFSTEGTEDLSPKFQTKIVDVMEKYKNKYEEMRALAGQKMGRMQTKLRLVHEIEEHEQFLDKELGRVFAEVQMMDGGIRCFTKAQLSYIFFTMVKMNAIIKEADFLEAFLGKLPYVEAKDFIIHNYELFTTEEFVLGQIDKGDLKKVVDEYRAQEQKNVINTYINNWSFLVSTFKDYTEFGTKSQGQRAFKTGIGRRLAQIIINSVKRTLKFGKDTSYNEYYSDFAKELLGMIPFIGNVPFLTSMLTTILTYLTDFVIDQILKYSKETGAAINSFVRKVWPVFKFRAHSEIYDLNYAKYLNHGEYVHEDGEQNPEAKIKLRITDVETVYSKQIRNSEKNGYEVFLFDKDTHSVKTSKLGLPAIQNVVKNLYDSGRLSPEGMMQFNTFEIRQERNQKTEEMLESQEKNYPLSSGGGSERLLMV